jgi:hypothetical protein
MQISSTWVKSALGLVTSHEETNVQRWQLPPEAEQSRLNLACDHELTFPHPALYVRDTSSYLHDLFVVVS